MKCVNPCMLRLTRSLCVEFDRITCNVSPFGELEECGPGAGTRVEHCGWLAREIEQLSQTRTFSGRQRVIAELDASNIAHGASPFIWLVMMMRRDDDNMTREGAAVCLSLVGRFM